MTLKDQIVFITGASSGIGHATAQAFAKEGARLIISARRMDRIDALAKDIRRTRHTDVYPIELDVRDNEAVIASVALLPDEWKQVDILVNNAGLSRGLEKLYECEIEDWEEMIDTNIKGLLYVTRTIVPGMVARNRGHIINIGSIAGHEVYPKGSVYCASKHAVDAITKGLRLDVYDTPLRVTTIDPGLVETEFSSVRFHGDSTRAEAVYKGFKPLQAEDIADAIVWSASRPAHVQIAEMIIFPTSQGSSTLVHRK